MPMMTMIKKRGVLVRERHNGRGGINKKGNIHPGEVALTIYHDDDHDDDDDDDHDDDRDEDEDDDEDKDDDDDGDGDNDGDDEREYSDQRSSSQCGSWSRPLRSS